jgi:hypothetical protein
VQRLTLRRYATPLALNPGDPLDAGYVLRGSITHLVRHITNRGAVDVTFSAETLGDPRWTVEPTEGTVAAGGATELRLRFAAGAGRPIDAWGGAGDATIGTGKGSSSTGDDEDRLVVTRPDDPRWCGVLAVTVTSEAAAPLQQPLLGCIGEARVVLRTRRIAFGVGQLGRAALRSVTIANRDGTLPAFLDVQIARQRPTRAATAAAGTKNLEPSAEFTLASCGKTVEAQGDLEIEVRFRPTRGEDGAPAPRSRGYLVVRWAETAEDLLRGNG